MLESTSVITRGNRLFRKNLLCQVGLMMAMAVSACNVRSDGDNKDLQPTDASLDLQASSYSRLSAELFETSCVECHNSSRPAAGIDLSTYEKLATGRTRSGEPLIVPGNANESRVYAVIRDGIMPPRGPIEGSLQALLNCWIDKGAKESEPDTCQSDAGLPVVEGVGPVTPPPPAPPAPVPTPEPAPTPLIASFPRIASELIQTSCVGCHSGPRPRAGIDLSSYAAIKAAGPDLLVPGKPEESLLYTVIAEGIMPPRGPAVAAELQELLRCWIASGAEESQGDNCTATQP